MTTLVLTVVGDDRAGLVATIAQIVESHGGNWENSELAELAGTFAGVIQLSVTPERVDELRSALDVLDGMLAITVHKGSDDEGDDDGLHGVTVTVLGNDRPGIVREVSSVFNAHDISIERLVTHTRDAAMAGGRLFEATMTARADAATDLSALQADLEQLAPDIQVDVALDA